MKQLNSLIIAILVSAGAVAQNLVVNGNFDQMTGCPVALSMIDSAVGWQNPTINGTPDFFHQCSSPFFAGVPVNGMGYQQPYSGESYGGVHRWLIGQQNYREYMEGQISPPLVAGECYYFEMHVSLANFSTHTSPDLGVLFSDTMLTGLINMQMIALTPQIVNPPNMLPDTANWMLVSGTYTATGGESFIIIGSFVSDAQMDTIEVNPMALWPSSYVYIDDILLTQCTGIGESQQEASVSIYPNPVRDQVTVRLTSNDQAEFSLYNVTGSMIFEKPFTQKATLNLSHLDPGIYIYKIRTADRILKTGKIIRL